MNQRFDFGCNWRKSARRSSFLMTPKRGVAAEDEARPTALLLAALLCLAPVTSGLARAEAVEERLVRFEISRQSADQALIAFAEQADVTFIFPQDRARKVMANEVRGEFTPRDAIQRLLEGTGLEPRVREDGAWSVSATKGSSEQGETVEKRGLLAGIIAILAGTAGGNARADQETEAQQAPARLGEIMVTAQKRAERMQDVPISITALTGDDISRRNLVHAEDYLRGMPSVSQAADIYGGAVVIRGIETHPSFQNYYTGATVASYFGETPTTATAGLLGGSNVDIKLIDIERVEVLRGPQGTAFGNSSLGGAVRTIPQAPNPGRFDAQVGAGYSSTSGYGGGNYDARAMVNIPVAPDKLAIRAVGYLFDYSGYYRNNAGSDPEFQSTIVEPYGAEEFAVDRKDVGAYYDHGARLSALLQATDNLEFTLSVLTQTSEIDGIPVATTGKFEQAALEVSPEQVRRGQRGGYSDAEIQLGNLVMRYDLGWGELLATYSHVESRTVNAVPYTAYSILWPMSAQYDSDHEEDSGEVRVASNLDGPWNFVAGAYYEDHHDVAFAPYSWTGDPATNFLNPNSQFAGSLLEIRDLQQFAVFGEVTWEFAPNWTITGGGRYYDYDRDTHFEQAGFFGSGSDDVSAQEDGSLFKANIGYHFNEDSLIYAGWSEGFRLGKPQSGLPVDLCDTDNDGIVDGTNGTTIESTTRLTSDTVENIELGVKFAALNRRLVMDAALFTIDWSEIPITTAAPVQPEGCGLGYTANAGKARSRGLEVQASFQINDSWRLDVGGSLVDAEFTEDAPGVGATDGTRLPGSPKENAYLALQYEFEIGSRPAFIRADSIYVGPFYTTLGLGTDPSNRAGDYFKLDMLARVTFGNVAVDLFAKNLTDEDAFTLRDPFYPSLEFYGYRLRPRTIGLNLTYNF